MTEIFGVVIADDDPVIRSLLGELIDDHPALRVVGLASDGMGAAALVAAHQPDLVVVDVMMPDGGAAAITAIHEVSPRIPVAVYTANRGRHVRADLLGAGAAAVFAKGDSIDLAEALLDVARTAAGRRPGRAPEAI